MPFFGELLKNEMQKVFQSANFSKNDFDKANPISNPPSEKEIRKRSQYDSIYTSESGEGTKELPEITDWRRAEVEDKLAIRQLQTLTGDVANLLYKTKNVEELIKNSYLSIVQFDSEGNLISFTAYDCYPNIPALPAIWKDWLTINYRLEGIDDRNVLFIHYMVWRPEQADNFLPVLLKILFTEFLYLKYIIVIKPPRADVPDFYSDYFIPVLPLDLEKFESHSIQLLLLCLRSSVVHPLRIRNVLGRELEVVMATLKKRLNLNSENWDLVNFVCEKNMKTLICETGGRMAGVMVLNLTIDLDVLNEGFDLAPFNGLRKNVFEDTELQLTPHQKKSIATDLKSSISIPESRLTFPNINWDSIDETGDTDATERTTSTSSLLSSVTFSFYRSLSQFSLLRLGSVIEVKKGDDKSQDVLQRVGKPSKNYHEGVRKLTFRPKEKVGSARLFCLQREKIPQNLLKCIEAKAHTNKFFSLFQTEDIDVVIHRSESTISHFFPPKYYGPVNAFVIDFYALDCNRIDEKLSSFDFLEAAFRVVPDRDYCILLIPTDYIPFPLMDLFVRVTPKVMTSIKQELYLFHKNLLSINSISVRSAKADDLAAIGYFLKDVYEGGAVYQDVLNECFGKRTDVKTFLLTVEETIAGISQINSQIDQFHTYFEVSDMIPGGSFKSENPVIKHLVINPIYHNHARFFLRDIMRLTDVSCVYYTHKKSSKSQRSLLTVLGEFFPVLPKKKPGLTNLFQGVSTTEQRKKNIFSLYFMSPPLCGFHKIHLNIIMVVVGASRTALSFLESLIYGPASYLFKYNNLICVTPQELKVDSEEESLRDLMFPIKDAFTGNYASMLSLEAYVSFIYGIMTAINRSEKYIVVNNKTVIKYDYLILTCGLQYLTPKNKSEQISFKNCRNVYRSTLARYYLGNNFSEKGDDGKGFDSYHPNNMFIINTSKDAQVALRSLQPLMQKLKNIRKNEKKIIVYGHDLQVFLTIHTLLKLGIPGEFIVLVEPFPPERSVTLFNDHRVDQAVFQSLAENKVGYYKEYSLHDWSMSGEDNISTIKFQSKYKQLDIPCLAFFPFIDRLVSDVTFNACNNAGLVYDGKLVINHNFRTNDRYIYAAGSFTKYARRYFANDYSHQYYNSREVGQKLAGIIRKLINPKGKRTVEKNSDLVPQLTAPIHVYCQLPGGFNLFMLRKPGKELDLETAYNFYDYGEVLTTGDCQMKTGRGYFRLHLNPEGFVESITCYTKDAIDYVSLTALYGLHEKILNNLLHRFDMAMISDFFEYFRQPWALALFHDSFQCLREYNYRAFFQKTSDDQIFFDKVIETLESNKWETLPETVIEELVAKYRNSKIQEDIKNNLMQFLEHYKQDLPVYATESLREKLIIDRVHTLKKGQF